MSYSGGVISYGLSVYGPALSLVGFPGGFATNRLSVRLELLSTDGDVVWRSSSFEGETSKALGLYYNFSAEFDGYPQLMHDAVKQWIAELVRIAPEMPSR